MVALSKLSQVSITSLAVVLLSACGGATGGGPIVTPPPAPTPTPTPTPTPVPTPTPTGPAVTAVPFDTNVLAANGSFSGSATRSIMNLGIADAIVQSASVDRNSLAIQYNAAQGSYSVSYNGDAATFRGSDRQGERFVGEASYGLNLGSANAQYLTLLTVPFISRSFATDIGYNRFVAQGYWQRNAASGSSQSINFTSFVFGQNTPASAMPRTGAAHWLVDIFGALTTAGKELRTVSGSGSFVVDFGAGAYVLESNLSESQFLTIGGAAGSLRLKSGGLLGSDATFQGPLTYDGSAELAGTLTGRFFGPAADEVGATFEASGGSSWLSGAFTGQRSRFAPTSSGIPNITLGNILTQGYQWGTGAVLRRRVIDTNLADVSSGLFTRGRVQIGPQGLIDVTDGQISYTFSRNDLISPPNAQFDIYRTTSGSNPVEVAIYRTDPSTGAIALTYMSFVKFNILETPNTTPATSDYRITTYFPYGVATLNEVMRAQRGTATYNGVAFGDAAQRGLGQFSLSGTTGFAIDFNAGTYNGYITLSGLAQGGFAQDTGRWTFTNNLVGGYMPETPLIGNLAESSMGSIMPLFYGPNGQEIGAPFSLTIGTDYESPLLTRIAGIAIAKQTGP